MKAEDTEIKDYRTDFASAEAKYKDKEVEVTGQLLSKKQFNNSQDYALVIYATEAGGKSYTVDVDIDKDKVTEANKVKNGDFVNVKGICVGARRAAESARVYIGSDTGQKHKLMLVGIRNMTKVGEAQYGRFLS